MKTVVIIRGVLILGAAGLLVWGVSRESHRIEPLVGEGGTDVDGMAFTEGATVDGFLRIRGRLYDAYTPLTPGQVQLKDCKT